MDVFLVVVFVVAAVWIGPAMFISSEVSTGNTKYALIVCLLSGPLGWVIILSIEYAKTVFQPERIKEIPETH